jgi:beta-glucosidase
VESAIPHKRRERGESTEVLKVGVNSLGLVPAWQSAMSYYSTEKKDWVAEPGQFDVLVGSSSRDIKLKGSFDLQP